MAVGRRDKTEELFSLGEKETQAIHPASSEASGLFSSEESPSQAIGPVSSQSSRQFSEPREQTQAIAPVSPRSSGSFNPAQDQTQVIVPAKPRSTGQLPQDGPPDMRHFRSAPEPPKKCPGAPRIRFAALNRAAIGANGVAFARNSAWTSTSGKTNARKAQMAAFRHSNAMTTGISAHQIHPEEGEPSSKRAKRKD